MKNHTFMSPAQRSAETEDDKGKSKAQKIKVDKLKMFISERSASCKLEFLKLALLIVTCCMILTLAFSPVIRKQQQSHSTSRSRFVEMAKIWQKTQSDPRYASHLDIHWGQISAMLKNLNAGNGNIKIGLLNFNVSELKLWQQTLPHAKFSAVRLDYADTSVTWNDLYPVWIDEEEESSVPACPSLPHPRVSKGSKLNLVAVKLPCDRSKSWPRDVARLHLQLAAAKVAADSAPAQARVLFVTDCLPLPNLFPCKDMVQRHGDLWLYKPDPTTLEEKLQLPIGSCQLATPFKAKVRTYTEVGRREAYATILHSGGHYVCGAIAAAHSIRSSGTARDLVILVDEAVSRRDRTGLEAAGWKVRTIRRIRNPKAKRDAYNEYNYSKFRLWQLTDYDKIVFIDADLLVLRNIDFLFALPEISAAGNDGTIFNSGLMVVEPSNCTFGLLMDRIEEITSYNGGDQGYLNEIFTWWHRVPRNMNALKYFWVGEDRAKNEKKNGLFGADPPVLYVIHYLGVKPWMCFRDYDCNWNVRMYWSFASDAAHETWWRMHDGLPEKLKKYCLLPNRVKASLEYNRMQAAKAEYPDGHWRKNITDPRLHI
ncbi:UDP-glucuronate:xylan alpha-glucuronosyltransferase 3 [Canna indica]|uniref:Hexosyltransferase n=1 Tax=Canna indica TaxID=4628 RepID=A0AAQ3Q3K1_9LILI|nr:UDP-glucuronate:xylan alpha-glucuronosyltransferase 3 [Canna indica]